MLVIYRTHSQTLGLYREEGQGTRKTYTILEVCHVHDVATIKAWQKRGAR